MARIQSNEWLARVTRAAEDLFGDPKKASRWMFSKLPELDGKTPAQTAINETGARKVEAIIHQIAHGIPA